MASQDDHTAILPDISTGLIHLLGSPQLLLMYLFNLFNPQDIIKLIMAKDLTSLREYDQLDMEKSRGNAFFGFGT